MKPIVAAFVLMVAFACAAGWPARAAESTPTLMNYQGRLATSGAEPAPITGTLPMEFRIYGSAVGSDVLWSEAWPAVEVAGGVFSVLLGSNVAISSNLFAGDSTRYLEIVVSGEVLAPRQRITSAPFAHEADRVDGHDGDDLEESSEIIESIAVHDAAPNAHPALVSELGALESTQDQLAEQVDQLVSQQQVNVKSFGAVGNGVADDTAAVLAAISALSASGGEVLFPRGKYLILGQLLLPNNGLAQDPRQPPYRFVGEGAHFDGRTGAPTGGTILDLRYESGPKIATYGLGLLEIRGLTLADFGTDGAPFVFTTNTTLLIHHASFYGTTFGPFAKNDAIILGGTAAESSVGSNSPNAPFQGYGTVISENYFGRIRRLVYGRVFANGVAFYANTSWRNCGNNLPGGAAIELDGDPDSVTLQVNAGWYVAGNLIEMPYYQYGIKVRNSQRSAFIANNFFDPGPGCLAYYRFENSGSLNYVLAGFHDDSIPFVDDQCTGNSRNTVLNPHQNQESHYPQKARFENSVYLEPGMSVAVGPRLIGPTGAELNYAFYGENSVTWQYKSPGGTEVPLMKSEPGALTISSTGAQIMSGDAVPSAAAPNGSIYLRTGGGAGATFYVREHGVWNPR
jgi:hypothetical protein